MEISIPIDSINTKNIYFVEKKKNIIVEGDFVKVVYSTESFEMNGVYIAIDFLNLFEETHVVRMDVEQDKSWIQIINKPNRDFIEGRKYEIESRDGKLKKIIAFDPRENKLLVEKLCKFESDIIKRYIEEHCPKKTATYILRNQLMTNAIKYHSENKDLGRKPGNIDRCILKISGIWETATNVGITMKFTLVC